MIYSELSGDAQYIVKLKLVSGKYSICNNYIKVNMNEEDVLLIEEKDRKKILKEIFSFMSLRLLFYLNLIKNILKKFNLGT